MIIKDTIFSVDLMDILFELRTQLNSNKIDLLRDIRDTPDNIMVTCVYHKNGQERKPSAGIKKSNGLYHCFTCGETHDLPEMISYCFGYIDAGTFGWEWLLKNFLTIQVENRKAIPIVLDRQALYNVNSNKQYISEEELDKYRYTHPYMYKRKLTDEIIELFDIGYDADSKCITFPIRDADGRTLFVARRSVVSKFFNYPSGVEKPVYGLYEYYQAVQKTLNYISSRGRGNGKTYAMKLVNEVIICESMLDALTCWVYGKYAVALNGLGNELQFKQLNDMPCRKFILATDMDEAGLKARKRLKDNIKMKLVTEYVWDVSKAKDINDMDKEMFDNLEEIF